MAGPITRMQSTLKVPIANGASLSGAIETRAEYPNQGIQIPTGFQGASMTFQVSADGITYTELRKVDSDAAVSLAITAAKAYPLPIELSPWPFFKLVAASNQNADMVVLITQAS